MHTSKVVITPTGSGEVLEAGPTTVTLLIPASSSNSEFGIVELGFPQPFAGIPLHAHEGVAHIWYVVSGLIDIQVGTSNAQLGAGSAVFIPAGTPHRVSVQRGPARILEIDTSGGLDDYYRELAHEFSPSTAVAPEAVAAIQARHATHRVSADPPDCVETPDESNARG